MKSADHPIWRILTLALCMVFVAVIIMFTAEEKSWNEVQEIIWAILSMAGAGLGYELFRAKMEK